MTAVEAKLAAVDLPAADEKALGIRRPQERGHRVREVGLVEVVPVQVEPPGLSPHLPASPGAPGVVQEMLRQNLTPYPPPDARGGQIGRVVVRESGRGEARSGVKVDPFLHQDDSGRRSTFQVHLLVVMLSQFHAEFLVFSRVRSVFHGLDSSVRTVGEEGQSVSRRNGGDQLNILDVSQQANPSVFRRSLLQQPSARGPVGDEGLREARGTVVELYVSETGLEAEAVGDARGEVDPGEAAEAVVLVGELAAGGEDDGLGLDRGRGGGEREINERRVENKLVEKRGWAMIAGGGKKNVFSTAIISGVEEEPTLNLSGTLLEAFGRQEIQITLIKGRRGKRTH